MTQEIDMASYWKSKAFFKMVLRDIKLHASVKVYESLAWNLSKHSIIVSAKMTFLYRFHLQVSSMTFYSNCDRILWIWMCEKNNILQYVYIQSEYWNKNIAKLDLSKSSFWYSIHFWILNRILKANDFEW